jgi:FixJ family two-component response regulator
MVYIVDDDESVREGLTNLLESADLAALAYASAHDFLAAAAPEGAACLLLDVHLQEASGFDVQQAMAVQGRKMPIIFMTGFGTIPMSVRALKAGAVEFLTKPIDADEMLQAVLAALGDAQIHLRDGQQEADWQRRHASLTPREQQVMVLVIGGLMNKQVAAELGISDITAKVHKRRVMEKMRARSLADLVRMAEKLRIGIVRTR